MCQSHISTTQHGLTCKDRRRSGNPSPSLVSQSPCPCPCIFASQQHTYWGFYAISPCIMILSYTIDVCNYDLAFFPHWETHKLLSVLPLVLAPDRLRHISLIGIFCLTRNKFSCWWNQKEKESNNISFSFTNNDGYIPDCYIIAYWWKRNQVLDVTSAGTKDSGEKTFKICTILPFIFCLSPCWWWAHKKE